MSWLIKKYDELSTGDLYDILKQRNEVFVVEQECAYQDCDGKDEHSYHMLQKDKDKIIAYLRIIKKGISYEQISIGRVLVNKAYRGKGIAREMMLKAISFIEQELGENEIRIQAQSYLADFYRSIGFKDISKIYLEDNIPHIDMIYKR